MENILEYFKRSSLEDNTLLEYLKRSSGSSIDYPEYDRSNPENWEVGDILCGDRGYTMSLPVFYKIVKRTAKGFTIARLKGKIVSGSRNGQWTEVATDELYGEKEESGRIHKWGGVRVGGKYGASLHLWNGQPMYGDDMD